MCPQFDFGDLESPLSGTVFINGNLEPWRDALHSLHSGDTRPSYAVAGMMWIDDTTDPWILKVFDGAQDTTIGTINITTNTFTPAGASQAADDITYDNAGSGLTATNVQDAIDEAYGDYDAFANRVAGFATAVQGTLAEDALPAADYQVGVWTAYTPVFTGFGTVSGLFARWRRVGDTLELDFKFTCGTSTATEGRMSLPSGLTIDSTKVPSLMVAGTGYISAAVFVAYTVTITGGDTYITFGRIASGGTTNGFSSLDGDDLATNGQVLGFTARVPIQGW